MTVYIAARMIHIAGALGLFMTLGVDLACMTALRRARTVEQVRRALEGYRVNTALGPISLALLLIPGIYMAFAWAWQPWLRVAFMTFLAIAALGATITRRRIGAIARALPADDRRLRPDLEYHTRDPLLRTSFILRAFLAVGVVVLMTTKPDLTSSVLVIGASAVAAAVMSTPFWMPSKKAVRV
jgi:hypothetical protein